MRTPHLLAPGPAGVCPHFDYLSEAVDGHSLQLPMMKQVCIDPPGITTTALTLHCGEAADMSRKVAAVDGRTPDRYIDLRRILCGQRQ